MAGTWGSLESMGGRGLTTVKADLGGQHRSRNHDAIKDAGYQASYRTA